MNNYLFGIADEIGSAVSIMETVRSNVSTSNSTFDALEIDCV